MIRCYKVKLQANAGKVAQLDSLLSEWQRLVREKIALFWPMEIVNGARPQLQYRLGTTLARRAADRAWRIVKGAKSVNQLEMPDYQGRDIDFGEAESSVEIRRYGHFDGWVKSQSLTSRKRLSLPFKCYDVLNEALETGTLAKGIKLIRENKQWFALLAVKQSTVKTTNTKRVGIDVGVTLAAATSTGGFYGRELNAIRKRTRHRKYRCTGKMPYRQGLNRVAKSIIADNPKTDFAVEQLNFKGKHNRTREFRRRLQNFAYGHLANRLEALSDLECFQVHRVNPAYTSQRCPACGHTEKSNRWNETFCCIRCSFRAHADTVGALNINGGKPVSGTDGETGRVSEDLQSLAATTSTASESLTAIRSE